MITIFTPTYNRAYTLTRLYESIKSQTCIDFEWLIIDDGSTDDTEELVQSFVTEKKVDIRYIKQKNGGKHRAINRGVIEAKYELFFIVDSDDYLTMDAIQFINEEYLKIKDLNYVGLSGMRILHNGNRVGGELKFDILDCSILDFRYKYKISGDLAEVFRTDILKEYPFPDIIGEPFCTEALVWNRISKRGLMRFINKGIYVCEYLPDGLTAKYYSIMEKSPQYSLIYYSELCRAKIPLVNKIKIAIHFWSISNGFKIKFSDKLSMMGWWHIFIIPFAVCSLLRKKYMSKKHNR